MMRLLNGGLAILLGALAAEQAGNTEAGIFLLLFALGALLAALGALYPKALALGPIAMLLSLTTASAILALLYFLPETGGWWLPQAWLADPEARRTTGLVVLIVGMPVPLATSVSASRAKKRAALAEKEQRIERRRAAALEGSD